MTKSVVHALRIISVLLFIFALYFLLTIILFQPWQPVTLGTLDPLPYPFTVGDPEINIWNAFVYFFKYSFGILGHLLSGGTQPFPFSYTGNAIVDWGYFWDNYTVSIYYFGFEMCIVVAVISMVIFLRKCNPEWSFRAFLFLIGMLILISLTPYAHYLSPAELAVFLGPLITVAWIFIFTLFGILLFKKAITNIFKKNSRGVFYICFAFFVLAVGYTSAGLFGTIPSFYVDSLSDSVINLNFVSFVTNPIFLAAFFMFLFLEVTYLTAYNYEIGKPALEREKIIARQMEGLERLGEHATVGLEAKAELHSISIRRFFSSEAFDFMREVIDKGVYDKETQARMANFRDFQQLQVYLEDLYIKDAEAKASLTARASLPSASKLAKASITGTGYRVLAVFLLILICFSPLLFFNILSILPSLITPYLEIYTIAAVMVLAIPLALLFPIVGSIFKERRMKEVVEKMEDEAKKAAEIAAKEEKIYTERTGEA
jgi:hypothetical protein